MLYHPGDHAHAVATDVRGGGADPCAPCAAGWTAALALGSWGCALAGIGARANIRAPIVEPQPPSSAAHPVTPPGDLLIVLGESLSFRCDDTSCDVEARYRIRAKEAINTELAFVLPQASPLAVHVGTQIATVDDRQRTRARARGRGPVRDRSRSASDSSRRRRRASRPRSPPGENVVSVSYKQPLGRREYGHGYFSRGRFVDYFRYELWPLSEWKHAAGFRIDGEVVIQRPAAVLVAPAVLDAALGRLPRSGAAESRLAGATWPGITPGVPDSRSAPAPALVRDRRRRSGARCPEPEPRARAVTTYMDAIFA